MIEKDWDGLSSYFEHEVDLYILDFNRLVSSKQAKTATCIGSAREEIRRPGIVNVFVLAC